MREIVHIQVGFNNYILYKVWQKDPLKMETKVVYKNVMDILVFKYYNSQILISEIDHLFDN